MRTLFLLFALLALAGCVTKNPDPNGPAYVADTARMNAISNQVAVIAEAARPVNPYAVPTNYAIGGVFGVAAFVAGILAHRKSTKGK